MLHLFRGYMSIGPLKMFLNFEPKFTVFQLRQNHFHTAMNLMEPGKIVRVTTVYVQVVLSLLCLCLTMLASLTLLKLNHASIIYRAGNLHKRSIQKCGQDLRSICILAALIPCVITCTPTELSEHRNANLSCCINYVYIGATKLTEQCQTLLGNITHF